MVVSIEPLLPNKPRGVPRANDCKVLNGIFWRLRTGAPWADIPERYGPPAACYNRFVRWRKLGVPVPATEPGSDRIFESLTKAYEDNLYAADSSSIKVHQHGANGKGRLKKAPRPPAWLSFEPRAWGVRGAA